MGIKTIPSTNNPRIWIRIAGDIIIRGTDQAEISVETGDKGLRLQQVGETLQIESSDDCRISLPRLSTLDIDKVGGDAAIREVSGVLNVRKVGGDLQLFQVGPTTIDRIGGDLLIQQASGEVHVGKAGGDVAANQVNGGLWLSAGGDLSIAEIGSLNANSGGDISVKLTKLDPHGYELRAGGDVECLLPEDASVELDLEAGSEEIDLRLPGAIEVIEKRNVKKTIGQGGPILKAKAGGDLRITCPSLSGKRGARTRWDEDLHDLGDRIRKQVEEGLRTADFSARLSSDITRRTETITQQAMQQAQARIQAVMQRMEHQPKPPTPPTPPNPASTGYQPVIEFEPVDDTGETVNEPVSDEERMVILQMLHEKKINASEAERLLAALEGRTQAS